MRSPVVLDLLDSCDWSVQWTLQKYRRNLLTEYQSVTIQGGVKVDKPTATRAPRRRSEAEQLELWKPRGGKRRGAGRKPKGRRAGSPHKTRPKLNARYPVHVVLRAIGAVGNLRRRVTYRAIREATLTTARREDFRIVHVSIQRTHVHLLVEANHKGALALGM